MATPTYSTSSRRLKPIFLRYRNDIDIFTEDKVTDKEFYKAMLNRLVNDSIKITDVIPLGSKSVVIKECNDDLDFSKKKLYIVDGDLDLISGRSVIHARLFTLNSYCIENFLIDESALKEMLWINIGRDRNSLSTVSEFNLWIDGIRTHLIEHFLHLSVLKDLCIMYSITDGKYHPVLKTVHDFLIQKSGETSLCNTKLSAYVDKNKKLIKDILILVGVIDYEVEYQNLINSKRAIWPSNDKTLLRIVSGKDYLLPLFQFKINKYIQSRSLFSIDVIKRLLASYCDLSRLGDLKRAIETA